LSGMANLGVLEAHLPFLNFRLSAERQVCRVPYTLHSTTLYPSPFTLHPTTYTSQPYTLHPTPYNRHPTPYTPCTLHPTPYNRHPTPYTPCTLHPTPYTLQATAYTNLGVIAANPPFLDFRLSAEGQVCRWFSDPTFTLTDPPKRCGCPSIRLVRTRRYLFQSLEIDRLPSAPALPRLPPLG